MNRNLQLNVVQGSTTLDVAARAEADILFSVCFPVCGSFGAGAEKPASHDAGTGKRLEPETGFCTVLTSAATMVKTVQKAAQILT